MKNTPTSSKKTVKETAEVIKLGLDIHANKYVVARQIDGSAAQSPQRFTAEGFIAFAEKQTRLGRKVYCCYEAGCFGYWLHRKLEEMGIVNYVVRPRNWDEYGQKVKTDNRDAKALLNNLDRYVAGNKKALAAVRVPTPEQEQIRSVSRQRDSLSKERKRLEAQGSSSARYYAYSLPLHWWKPKNFEAQREELPEHLFSLLEVWQKLLLAIDATLAKATAAVELSGARLLPVGLGALTAACLDNEICDWNRFGNRREVASFSGLCPKEDSSGGRHMQGSITKHGNTRVRHLLLEAVWRMLQFQDQYKAVVYWKDRIADGPAMTKARKKKIAVAIARQFLVDWWRIQTGKMTPDQVGLKMALPQSPSLSAWRTAQRKACS